MMQEVFKIFTIEHKIILSKDTLTFLSTNNFDKSQLTNLAIKHKQLYGTRQCTPQELKKLINHKNTEINNFFEIINIKNTQRSLKEKYNHLRTKIPFQTTFIYNLQENVPSYIFGIYYLNNNNEEILEDELNEIKLDLKCNTSDVFLVKNMFVCLYGKRKKGKFVVDELHLPEIKKNNKLSNNLIKKDVLILFFSGMVEISKLKKIIFAFDTEPEIILFSGGFGNKLMSFCENLTFEFPKINFILVPDVNEGIKAWLPKHFKYDPRMESFKNKNIHFATNPCEIKLYNRKIIVIKDDMIRKLKNSGIYSGDSHVDSLKNLLFSQFSYHFLDMPYHFYNEVPDFFLIHENYIEILDESGGINLVVNSEFEKDGNSFVVYDSSTNTAEISSFK